MSHGRRLVRPAAAAVLALMLAWGNAGTAWAGAVYALGVDGLACPFCAYGIEKRLKSLPGVAAVEVHIARGEVIVRMEDAKTLTRKQLETEVTKAGFTLRAFRERNDGR